MKKLFVLGAFMFSLGAFAQAESNQLEQTPPIKPGTWCYVYPLSTCDENGNSTGDMAGPIVLISSNNWNAAGKAEKVRIYCETGIVPNDCPPK